MRHLIETVGCQPSDRILSGVELDERAVAGPAARAARVFDLRRDAEMPDDRRDRLVDDNRLVRSEVVDMNVAWPVWLGPSR